MVVLEGGGGIVTIGNNQYLQPDYLSPLPVTMDSKKSPLALLAQTCSQIGADSSSVKPILSMEKNKKSPSESTGSAAKSPNQAKTPKSTTPTSTEVKLAFKPYETNVLSQQNHNSFKSSPSSSSSSSSSVSPSEDNGQMHQQQQHMQHPHHQHHHQQQQQQQHSQRPNSKSSSHSNAGSGGGGGGGVVVVVGGAGGETSRVPSRSKSNCSPEMNGTKGSSEASEQQQSYNQHHQQQQQQQQQHPANHHGGKSSPNGGGTGSSSSNDSRKTVSPAGSSQRGASPIVRSGMEILHGGGHPKDMGIAAAVAAAAAYKAGAPPYGLNPLSALCCPPGMEQHTNPAFRPPFTGGFSHHQAAMFAAAAANSAYQGGPGGAGGNGGQPNGYITYQRIKTPSGGEAIVPVCKDPYCPGCPYSAHSQQMMMGAPCPSGCTQCEHQKYGLAMAASMGSLPPGHPYSQAAAAAAASAAQMRSSPYVCSWVIGDSYCGKRFNTSDELFTHLRTHTGNLSDPAAAAAALAQSQTQSLLSSLFPPSALQRGYPTPPLSPMSAAAAAARYHPYAKPGGLPSPLGGPSPFGGAFNSAAAAAAALGPYYSPYAMYGQRIGSAAVHQ